MEYPKGHDKNKIVDELFKSNPNEISVIHRLAEMYVNALKEKDLLSDFIDKTGNKENFKQYLRNR